MYSSQGQNPQLQVHMYMCTCTCESCTCAILFQELVLEKETRIRESMLMMGLQQWVLWTTWFIKQFLFLSTSTLVVTLLLKVHDLINEPLLPWLQTAIILYHMSLRVDVKNESHPVHRTVSANVRVHVYIHV